MTKNRIFGYSDQNGWAYAGFGDVWAFVNYCNYERDVWISNKTWNNYLNLIQKIQKNLNTNLSLRFIDNNYNHKLFAEENPHPYIETKIHWGDRYNTRKTFKQKKICFQLKTLTNHWNSERFFTKEDILEFKKWMIGKIKYFNFIELGKHFTIEENIKIASESEIFIGIDSGMSHLCHSVGIPIYLKNFTSINGCLDKYHPNKQYHKFKNFKDILPHLNNLL